MTSEHTRAGKNYGSQLLHTRAHGPILLFGNTFKLRCGTLQAILVLTRSRRDQGKRDGETEFAIRNEPRYLRKQTNGERGDERGEKGGLIRHIK